LRYSDSELYLETLFLVFFDWLLFLNPRQLGNSYGLFFNRALEIDRSNIGEAPVWPNERLDVGAEFAWALKGTPVRLKAMASNFKGDSSRMHMYPSGKYYFKRRLLQAVYPRSEN
jgi:hypothetical protein